MMEKIYFNPENPAGFGGINRLREASKKPIKQIKNFLYQQDVYTLHTPVRKRFLRSKIYSRGIHDLFEMDLMDMSALKRYNNGYSYLLVVIDVFSKYAWVFPLRRKTGIEVARKLKLLFQDVVPRNIRSDKGTEFTNKTVQKLLKEHNINFYTSQNELKAAISERLIRTLKGKLYRYMTHIGKYRYIDVLPLFLKAYNASKHRSIQMAPKDVTKKDEAKIHARLYGTKQKVNFKLKPGDLVRLSKERMPFKKGYTKGYTEEVFRVKKALPSFPPRYILEDLLEEPIKGSFYELELQKVIKTPSSFWAIEKVLKSRVRNKRKEYLVKFKGFSNRFNLWIPEEDIRPIK